MGGGNIQKIVCKYCRSFTDWIQLPQSTVKEGAIAYNSAFFACLGVLARKLVSLQSVERRKLLEIEPFICFCRKVFGEQIRVPRFAVVIAIMGVRDCRILRLEVRRKPLAKREFEMQNS